MNHLLPRLTSDVSLATAHVVADETRLGCLWHSIVAWFKETLDPLAWPDDWR